MGSVFLAEMGGSGRRGGEGWPVCGPGWLTGPRVVSGLASQCWPAVVLGAVPSRCCARSRSAFSLCVAPFASGPHPLSLRRIFRKRLLLRNSV